MQTNQSEKIQVKKKNKMIDLKLDPQNIELQEPIKI